LEVDKIHACKEHCILFHGDYMYISWNASSVEPHDPSIEMMDAMSK
jgi:hypothetical protein